MDDAIVELNSETREIFAPAARCEAKATAEAHVTRVPVRPAKHSCHEPTRPTSGRRNLARPSPSVDRSVQVTEHKASIGSLFAELYRTGRHRGSRRQRQPRWLWQQRFRSVPASRLLRNCSPVGRRSRGSSGVFFSEFAGLIATKREWLRMPFGTIFVSLNRGPHCRPALLELFQLPLRASSRNRLRSRARAGAL